jgi:hypothetical protein
VVEDLAQSILQLCDAPIDVEFMEKLPASCYGFPCGLRKDFLAERAKIPESLFVFQKVKHLFSISYFVCFRYDLKYMDGTDEEKSALMNISQIAMTSCGICEPDIRTVSIFFVEFHISLE